MFPTLAIGPITLPVPAILILLSLWIGMHQSDKFAARLKIEEKTFSSLLFIALLSTILGARISYVARYPGAFLASWTSFFSLNMAMMDWLGGILLGFLALFIFISRNSLPLWQILDALVPMLSFLQVAINLAEFASGTAYGTPTNLPWGIFLWGAFRHPQQLYATLVSLGITWLLYPRKCQAWQPGIRAISLVGLSAFARIFLEYFRADSRLIFAGVRLPQISALVILLLSLWILQGRIKNNQSVSKNTEVNDGSHHNQ